MRRCLLLAVLIVLTMASTASAQATRTWVSGVGDDANPCSRTAPCKTFAGAISKTASGGEIDALDPGGYGAVTITKPITIDGGAGLSGVLAGGTNGVTVNIPDGADPARPVVLRNLTISGVSAAVTGVRVLRARAVRLEDVRIAGFRTGVEFIPSSTGAASLLLDGVTISDIQGNGLVAGAPGGGPVEALVRDTVITGARGTDGGSAGETGIGVAADTGARVQLTRTSVFDNLIGLKTFARTGAAGVIESWCDDQVRGNVDDGIAPVRLCPDPPTQTVVVPGDPVVVERAAPARCEVPDLKGLTPAVAKRVLGAARCSLGTVQRKKARKARRGKVVAQAVAAGTALAEGAPVAVTVGRK